MQDSHGNSLQESGGEPPGAGSTFDAVALEQEKRTEGVAVDQFIEGAMVLLRQCWRERRLVFVHLVEVEAVAVVLVADHPSKRRVPGSFCNEPLASNRPAAANASRLSEGTSN